MDRSEFQQHPLWDEIRARMQFWDDMEEGASAPLQDARDRAVAVGRYVLGLKVAGEASPALFSSTMLENARSNWSQATGQYDNESYYPNMHQGLDGVLDVVARWPATRSAVSNARAVTEIYAVAAQSARETVELHAKGSPGSGASAGRVPKNEPRLRGQGG